MNYLKANELPLFIFSLIVFLFICIMATQHVSAASGPQVPSITNVKCHYGTVIRETAPRSDGKYHVDTPATIARVQELNVTTFAYLMWTRTEDWDDFRLEFLPAAQAAGIKVWAYLTPPSEGCPVPYGGNYTEWVRQIANLSLIYPNLEAWAMDDFTANLNVFTPQDVKILQDYAHTINPKLAFFACAYVYSVDEAFANNYKDCIDGIIFPHCERTEINLEAYINSLYDIMHPRNIPIYFTPYATFSNYSSMKSAETIKREMEIAFSKYAEGKLQGFFIYCTPLETSDENWLLPNDPHPFPTNGDWYYEFTNDELMIPWATHYTAAGANATVQQTAAVTAPNITSISFDAYSYAQNGYTFGNDGNVAIISFPGATPGVAGIYGEISQVVNVTGGANAAISFKVKDDYTGGVSGYIYKQFLVDDVVVWQEDVAGQNGNWETVNLNLSPYLTGKSTAKVQLRLKNAAAVTYFNLVSCWDDIVATGFKVTNPYFDGNTGWTKSQSGSTAANSFTMSWPAAKASVAGAVAAKDKIASIQPASLYKLDLKVRDDFIFAVPGYHFMQVLVDGILVWERDVSGGSGDWSNVSLDLTSRMTGKTSAIITFRVYDKAGVSNFPVKAEWAITSTTGFTLSDSIFASISGTSNLWQYYKGSSLSIRYPEGVASTIGSFGGVSMNSSVIPGSGSKTLDFQVKDNYTSSTYPGYHFAQVVVDGAVVWERDVAGETTAWQSVQLDLTQALAEKLTANIVFRVYDKQAVAWFPVNVEFTNIQPNGFTLNDEIFCSTSGWAYSEQTNTYLGPYTTEIVTQPSGMVLLQMLVDGKVAWSQDASRLIASPWARYKVDTSAYTAGKSSVNITFRMYFSQAAAGLAEIIRLDNLAVEGMTMQNLSFEDATGWTSTFTDQNIATGYGGPKRGVRVFNIIKEFYE